MSWKSFWWAGWLAGWFYSKYKKIKTGKCFYDVICVVGKPEVSPRLLLSCLLDLLPRIYQPAALHVFLRPWDPRPVPHHQVKTRNVKNTMYCECKISKKLVIPGNLLIKLMRGLSHCLERCETEKISCLLCKKKKKKEQDIRLMTDVLGGRYNPLSDPCTLAALQLAPIYITAVMCPHFTTFFLPKTGNYL